MIGKVVGQYRILAKIGEGGMGAVYRAEDRMLQRQVAIKVLRSELARQKALIERFRTEAIALARLNHPNIATVYGLLQEGTDYYMVLEFVEGDTLEQILTRRGPLPWREAVQIAKDILQALDHAHSMGVVHRDLKPANLMVNRSGVVKVMDFGIARLAGTSRHTEYGRIVGTPLYMSPEQLRGEEVDGRSDVYALAIVLYELLTGREAFEADSDYALLMAQLNKMPEPPSRFVAGIPVSLDQTMARAMAKSKADRWPNATTFRWALNEIVAEPVTRSPTPPPRPAAAPPPAPPQRPLSTAPAGPTRVARPEPELEAPTPHTAEQPVPAGTTPVADPEPAAAGAPPTRLADTPPAETDAPPTRLAEPASDDRFAPVTRLADPAVAGDSVPARATGLTASGLLARLSALRFDGKTVRIGLGVAGVAAVLVVALAIGNGGGTAVASAGDSTVAAPDSVVTDRQDTTRLQQAVGIRTLAATPAPAPPPMAPLRTAEVVDPGSPPRARGQQQPPRQSPPPAAPPSAASPGDDPAPPPAPPPPPAAPPESAAAPLERADFLNALGPVDGWLRNRQADAVERTYATPGASDRTNKAALLELIDRFKPQLEGIKLEAMRSAGGEAAEAEYTAELRWRSSFGNTRKSPVRIVATFGRRGAAWVLRSWRFLGEPDLD